MEEWAQAELQVGRGATDCPDSEMAARMLGALLASEGFRGFLFLPFALLVYDGTLYVRKAEVAWKDREGQQELIWDLRNVKPIQSSNTVH